jgi:hypothetical protein
MPLQAASYTLQAENQSCISVKRVACSVKLYLSVQLSS